MTDLQDRSSNGGSPLPVHRPDVGEAEFRAVHEVLASGWYGRGPVAGRFESAVEQLVGAPHVVGVATGTAAIHLALHVVGVTAGDEVIVPSLTYAATYQAIRALGAVPRFADVDPRTGCLDPGDAGLRLTERTRAILLVHYGGYAGGRASIAELADSAGVTLVEDAAHAVGSRVAPDGPRVGETGNPVCFSFDPVKSITCGQGGAVAVGDAGLAERLRIAANLGLDPHGDGHQVVGIGWRYQLPDLNAALGLAQLEGFERRADRRRQIWHRYAAGLSEDDGFELLDHDVDSMVPFLFAIRVLHGRRDALRRRLADRGIRTAFHYPPGHLQAWGGEEVRLPATERLASELLTLPFYVGLTDEEIDFVIDAVRAGAGHR